MKNAVAKRSRGDTTPAIKIIYNFTVQPVQSPSDSAPAIKIGNLYRTARAAAYCIAPERVGDALRGVPVNIKAKSRLRKWFT